MTRPVTPMAAWGWRAGGGVTAGTPEVGGRGAVTAQPGAKAVSAVPAMTPPWMATAARVGPAAAGVTVGPAGQAARWALWVLTRRAVTPGTAAPRATARWV